MGRPCVRGTVQVFSTRPGGQRSHSKSRLPQPILQHFHHPKEKPRIHELSLHFPQAPNPNEAPTHLLSVSTDLHILCISYTWNHTVWYSVSGFFHRALCPCCVMNQHFTPFACPRIFHYGNVPYFVYPFIR